MVIELMKPAGADLARRWIAALMTVPEDERAAVVEAVERRIFEEWPPSTSGPGGPAAEGDGAERD